MRNSIWITKSPLRRSLLKRPLTSSFIKHDKWFIKQEIIIRSHRVGKSHRQISRELQFSHKTLKKYIEDYVHLQGVSICYTTVCNYIREKLGKSATQPGTFIRQLYDPELVCEFDWGKLKLNIDGHLLSFKIAVFIYAYSNYRYAMINVRIPWLLWNHMFHILNILIVFTTRWFMVICVKWYTYGLNCWHTFRLKYTEEVRADALN